MNCPKCGTEMRYDTTAALYRCPACLHRVDAPRESLEQAAARVRERGQRPAVPITYRGALEMRTRALFEQGHDALWNDDEARARNFFLDALDIQNDFIDAYLALARIAPTPEQQRDYLEHALAHDPGSAEALRMLMALTGRMTPAQVERSRSSAEPNIQRPSADIATSTQITLCPVCGGRLTVDHDAKQAVCAFCGHQQPLQRTADPARTDVLGMALLEQRAAPVKWVVGRRLLHCQQCGGERTLTREDASALRAAQMLSVRCRFCGSHHVVLQDALGTLRQPSHLVPFSVNAVNAQESIRSALRSLGERLYSGLMAHNRVEHASIEPLFAPFWVFDILLRVTQSHIYTGTPRSRSEVSAIEPYRQIEYSDSLLGLAIPAVSALPAELCAQIGGFELSAALPYSANALADRPAALYDIDFERASLEARSIASAQMRQRYERSKPTDYDVNTFTTVIQATFSLMLLPLWVGTLIERDGDVRTAVVHGQTAQAAVGRGRKL